MRLSVDEKDPGYGPDIYDVTILLDGAPIKNVITADEELGELLVSVTDAEGHFVLDKARDCFVTETRRGKVQIIRDA